VPTGRGAELVIDNYVDGTLVVDLIDTKTKELVWRVFLLQKIENRDKAYKEAKKNLYKALGSLPPTPEEIDKMRRQREKMAAKYR
jgi:hypothetical protein